MLDFSLAEGKGGFQEFYGFPDDTLVVLKDVVPAVNLEALPVVV